MSTEVPKIESLIKSAYKCQTLDEMLQAYYGPAQEYLGKADPPITISTTGVRNVVYGKDGTSPMSVIDWTTGLKKQAPHLFQGSQGGGAQGSGKGNVDTSKLTSAQKIAQGLDSLG